MGAEIWGRKGGTLAPLAVRGGALHGIPYTLPVASAQVKSAIVLAALHARGETAIAQPALSRDHTERMLRAMGNPVREDGLRLTVTPGPLKAIDVRVPGDFSAAVFWLVAAVCHPNARVRIANVGMNPGRTGALDVLLAMGARIRQEKVREEGGEPVADLVAESSDLRAAEIRGDLIPRLIDEVPALSVAACFARGTTVVADAQELRVKESDRIAATVQELSLLGADAEERPDGMVVRGTGVLNGARVQSHGDHRLAMSMAIAGLLASGETVVNGSDAASISYPSFWQHLGHVTGESRRGRD
jgi:3-phosphoshikimate 1-carboxyvinyltransferase